MHVCFGSACAYVCRGICVEVLGQLGEISFLFHHIVSRNQTQFVSLGIKYSYPLSHLCSFNISL